MEQTISQPQTLAEAAQLKSQWEKIKAENPQWRIRDISKYLGVGEAALLATDIGQTCQRLEGQWEDFAKQLPRLGYVMALTRNESCVLEHKGKFEKISTFHGIGQSIGAIETRMFFHAWHVGFAVVQETPRGVVRSLQIFDKAGEAILKVFLQEESNLEAYFEIVEQFTSPDQTPIQPLPGFEATTYATDIDVEAFHKDWAELQDTHDFFKMLKNFQLHRLHALQLADKTFAYEVSTHHIRPLLEQAADIQLPIMIFAGNKGNIQIHIGRVKTIKVIDQWLNVLDPAFNMHLRQDQIHTAWVVRKPTADGIVTSIELFDQTGELIAQFFGERKPGKPELAAWRDLVRQISPNAI
ncbi:MAG TPA: hemin-degrading factor [Microscillaceae bacterium]|jgi:putative hemin transport protein|nr:hemin-degrading factor [Microscillaceae bacterium]